MKITQISLSQVASIQRNTQTLENKLLPNSNPNSTIWEINLLYTLRIIQFVSFTFFNIMSLRAIDSLRTTKP